MKQLARRVLVCALVAFSGAAGGQDRRLTAAYDVHTGGFRAVEMEIELGVEAGVYAIEARLRTRGFFATLFPWEQSNRVIGTLRAEGAAPARFEQHGRFRGQERSAEILYRAGKVDSISIAPTGSDDGDREQLARDEVENALDPLTGIVTMMLRVEGGGDCAGGYDGFDGRRRFRVELVDAGLEPIEASLPGGALVGREARICDFVYRQTGGFARRVSWGPDRQREPRPGRVWLTRVVPGGAVLPVRMEMENSWGRMIAHLREVAQGR
jgi:hypothetical protein